MDEKDTISTRRVKADLALWVMGSLLAALVALMGALIVSSVLEREESVDAIEGGASAAVRPPDETTTPADGIGTVHEGVDEPETPESPATLPHEVYVWQRRWDAELARSLVQAGEKTSRFLVLAAEVTWRGRQPQTFRVPVDYAALRAAGRPVGLVVRIQPYNGPFDASDPVLGTLKRLAATLVEEARSGGVEPVEVQIDFDCAESKLDGYRVWVSTLRRTVRPIPLTITALPAWLKHASFEPLVQASDGFTLQVHMRKPPPEARGQATLCHPPSARAWVTQAASAGVPFRVALPTYGYVGVFWPDGGFVGPHLTGTPREPGTVLRIVHADPFELVELVREWEAGRPANLQAFVWYRLPVPADTMNWTWTTLVTVIDGQTPTHEMRVEVEPAGAHDVEVYLVNTGTVDLAPGVRAKLAWRGGPCEGTEALSGYAVTDSQAASATLESTDEAHLVRVAPGERLKVARLRFGRRTDVTGVATATTGR